MWIYDLDYRSARPSPSQVSKISSVLVVWAEYLYSIEYILASMSDSESFVSSLSYPQIIDLHT